MDFEQRLQRAVQRGQHRRDAELRERAQAQLTEEQLRALHAQSRLTLSDHIEQCLHKLVDSFPGFKVQTVVTTEGFGAKVTRDDLRGRAGQSLQHEYSHLELVVRSYTPRQILEVTVRGTIANKEVLQRTHYQRLSQLDLESFADQIDHWILEYAERFAAA